MAAFGHTEKSTELHTFRISGEFIKKLKNALSRILGPRFHPRHRAYRAYHEIFVRGKVVGGPFRNMRYGKQAVGSTLPPKIFGIYEKELWPVWKKIIQLKPSTIMDVGAAEGYYAVGFARALQDTRVIAFEISARGRKLLKSNAKLNNCDRRIQILGRCSEKNLSSTLAMHRPELLIMDVEGAEYKILKGISPNLLNAAILVIELHPWVEKNIKNRLLKKFRRTHQVQIISTKARNYLDIPKSKLSDMIYARWWKELVNEKRPGPMEWLVLFPKSIK